MSTISKIIIYLDRQQIIVAGNQLPTPLKLELPVNIVSDIDIIDADAYELLVTNFLVQSKLITGNVILVISPDVYYQKNIVLSTDSEQRQSQIDNFLEIIPYKNLIYKDYPVGNQPCVVALNRNYYEPLVKVVEKNNINIVAVIPYFILENYNLKLTDYLPKEVKDIFQKSKLLLPFSLITSQDIDKITSIQIHKPKEDNTRAYILLAVFCLLFVVLLGFIFVRPRLMKPPLPIVTPNKSNIQNPSPTINQTTPTPTIEFVSKENLRIKVVNSSGVANQAAKIKQSLISAGFKQITPSSSSVVTATKNTISFSPSVNSESRQLIRQTVETIAGLSTEIESSDLIDFDVLITTTKIIGQPTP